MTNSMDLKRSPSKRTVRLGSLDALMVSYVNWRDESRAVAESWRKWNAAPGSDRGAAFDQYVAALDREEHAAAGYRRFVEWALNS
jgi:hypothetical protein